MIEHNSSFPRTEKKQNGSGYKGTGLKPPSRMNPIAPAYASMCCPQRARGGKTFLGAIDLFPLLFLCTPLALLAANGSAFEPNFQGIPHHRPSTLSF
jgi:hypothetical protein